MNKPLVWTALELEARAIRRELAAAGLTADVEAIGIGACRIPKTLPQVSRLIMAGLAGALDPALRIGDIVTGEAIHTTDHLIATPAEKVALFRETGARAVDMENAIVRRAAEAAGIPFIGIRAISDTANQAIDPAVLTLTDDVGRPRLLAVTMLLLRRPAMAGRLRQLQRQSTVAAAALGEAVKTLLARG
jgi:adenosylhomocysteine nucleosidase